VIVIYKSIIKFQNKITYEKLIKVVAISKAPTTIVTNEEAERIVVKVTKIYKRI
jgi:hypothetical protein